MPVPVAALSKAQVYRRSPVEIVGLNPSGAWIFFCCYYCVLVGRDSSVGIATRYGLDGQGIESRWGRDFPHPSRPALGPTSLLYNGDRDFTEGKAAGAWC